MYENEVLVNFSTVCCPESKAAEPEGDMKGTFDY
jgi:hypothetical protein